METEYYVRLHHQCLYLWNCYFSSVTHAPVIYKTLGRSLENLAFALESVCMLVTHQSSRLVDRAVRQSASKVLWLGLYRLSDLFDDVETFLCRLKITQNRPPQWWVNFAQKARFGHSQTFVDLIQRSDFHIWALHTTTRTFNGLHMGRMLDTYSLWVETLETVMQQQLSRGNATIGSESGSIHSSVDQHIEIEQEFIANSDYHDGRDIFEVANIMTMIRYAMYWTHRGTDGLGAFEITKSFPLQAYVNILKAGWILQRLQQDQRSRSDECTAIIRALIEDVIFQLKRINELNVALPTNQQLVQEGDLRVWLDDLDESEAESQTPGVLGTPLRDDYHQTMVSPLFSKSDTRNDAAWRSAGSDITLTTETVPTSPSQASDGLRSPDSRTNSTTFSSRVNAQRSSLLSQQSSQSSSAESSLAKRKQLPSARQLAIPLGRTQSLGPDSMQFGVPPLHSHSSSRDVGLRETRGGNEPMSSPYTNGPDIPSKHPIRPPVPLPLFTASDLEAYDPANPPSEFGGHQRQSIRDDLALSPAPDPRDLEERRGELDERPGELEIMRDCFRSMELSASEGFELNPFWEKCTVRIFRREDGSARVLTLLESKVDYRYFTLKETEIVPEYGYHNSDSSPVIYLRKSTADRSRSTVIPKPPGTDDPAAASLYYKFKTSDDMFNFQLAFTGEGVVLDMKGIRTVRYKRGLRDGEHSQYKARIQLWREQFHPTVASSVEPPYSRTVSGTIRSQGTASSALKFANTRLVIYFEETMVFLFVTDSITIDSRAKTNVIRIKPSSWSKLINPNSVRACFLGARQQSGGFKLDKKGLTHECEDGFEEFKWFELDFDSSVELASFRTDFNRAIEDRRRERSRVEELKRQAGNAIGKQAIENIWRSST